MKSLFWPDWYPRNPYRSSNVFFPTFVKAIASSLVRMPSSKMMGAVYLCVLLPWIGGWCRRVAA